MKRNPDCGTAQEMTYAEQESLKSAASRADLKSSWMIITMMAHWMRQRVSIEFTDYAANWIAANEHRYDCSYLRAYWPLHGERRIADGCSDWDSYGKAGYPMRARQAKN